MDKTKDFLNKIGIEETFSDFTSSKRFNDGGQYRFEVPGIQSPKTMKTLLNESTKNDVFIHRVTQTKGIMLLSDSEIEEMVNWLLIMDVSYSCLWVQEQHMTLQLQCIQKKGVE